MLVPFGLQKDFQEANKRTNYSSFHDADIEGHRRFHAGGQAKVVSGEQGPLHCGHVRKGTAGEGPWGRMYPYLPRLSPPSPKGQNVESRWGNGLPKNR
jgi:hypothetical protein